MNFAEVLVPICVVGFLILGVVTMTRLLTGHFLRKRLVDKGLVSDEARAILEKQEGLTSKYTALKWGLIVLFTGLGLIIAEMIGFSWDNSAIPFGILAVCISAGFLVYYYIVKDKIQ